MTGEKGRARLDFNEEKAKQVDLDFKNRIEESWKSAVTIDDRLSKSNFVTNGAGALATLAFIGSGRDQSLVIWSLTLFTIGVIAHVIELRAYKATYWAIHKDSVDRFRSWLNNDLYEQDIYPKGIAKLSSIISKTSSYVSQGAFVLGVLIGGYKFVWSTI